MKKQNKKEINKKMTFGEIIEKNPEAMEILLENGMHCCGCPMSANESLEQGADAHGINADELIKKINNKKHRKKNDSR
jgi:hybrid cluster-associated redox disulfide protein